MTLTTIEKAAKLIGYELSERHPPAMEHLGATINGGGKDKMFFNPYTNKADLSDVIDELGISVNWHGTTVVAFKPKDLIDSVILIADHPDKFTARAHAVMAVVEQIYDAKFGGQP